MHKKRSFLCNQSCSTLLHKQIVQAALARILPASLKAELEKQMAEESELNKSIKDNLSKVVVHDKA